MTAKEDKEKEKTRRENLSKSLYINLQIPALQQWLLWLW